ncbi:MAG: hypothetical protein MHM6MM_001241 [Cercozoa sp. M6MM]
MQAIDHSEVVNVTREQKARGIRLRDSVLSIPDDIDMRDPVSCFCDPSGSSNDNVFHTQVRRVLGLVNPKSGGGKALRRWRKLAAKLEANDIETEVHETQSAADFTLIAACCDLRNLCDVLVVVGGDGTLHELTQGFALRAVLENSNRVIECPVPVCILAAGTGNNVLRTMGALDTETVAQALIRGSYRYIDVFRCHLCERDTVDDAVAVECPDFLSGPLGPREFPSQQQCQQYLQLPLDSVRVKFAINNLAWALGVDTTRSAEHHRWARLMRYDIGAVSSLLRYRHHRATLIVDGREIASQDWDYIGAQNNQHGGAASNLAPFAVLDDGMADLVTFGKHGRFSAVGKFLKLGSGRHVLCDGLDYLRARSFCIVPEEPSFICIDGENFPMNALRVDVLRRVLPLVVPIASGNN